MNTTSSTLDAEELFHLGLSAADSSNHEAAIEFLNRALEMTPNDAKVVYMLGAVHAQIGLFDRAVEEISRSIELDPSISAAHFQLGLLYLTSGYVDEADKAWQSLDQLGVDNFFYLLKTGLLHLVNDNFSDCIDFLERGIAANNINQPLNNDMQKVLAAAQIVVNKNEQLTSIVDEVTTPKLVGGKKLLLSAYENNQD